MKVREAAVKLQKLLPPEPTDEALKGNKELRARAFFYRQVGQVAGRIDAWFMLYRIRTGKNELDMREKIGNFMQAYLDKRIPDFSQYEGGTAIKKAVFSLYNRCYAAAVALQVILYPIPERPDKKE